MDFVKDGNDPDKHWWSRIITGLSHLMPGWKADEFGGQIKIIKYPIILCLSLPSLVCTVPTPCQYLIHNRILRCDHVGREKNATLFQWEKDRKKEVFNVFYSSKNPFWSTKHISVTLLGLTEKRDKRKLSIQICSFVSTS